MRDNVTHQRQITAFTLQLIHIHIYVCTLKNTYTLTPTKADTHHRDAAYAQISKSPLAPRCNPSEAPTEPKHPCANVNWALHPLPITPITTTTHLLEESEGVYAIAYFVQAYELVSVDKLNLSVPCPREERHKSNSFCADCGMTDTAFEGAI